MTDGKMLEGEFIVPDTDETGSKRPVLSIASYVADAADEEARTPRKRRRLFAPDTDPNNGEERSGCLPPIPPPSKSLGRRRSSVFLIRRGSGSSQQIEADDAGEAGGKDGTSNNDTEIKRKNSEDFNDEDTLVDEAAVADSLDQLTTNMGDWSIMNVRRMRRNNILSSVRIPKTELRRAKSDVMRFLRRDSHGDGNNNTTQPQPSTPRKTSTPGRRRSSKLI